MVREFCLGKLRKLKRFDMSLEWFIRRVQIREQQIEKIRADDQIQVIPTY